MKTKLGILILVLTAAWARAQTNDLTALLQQGLFEEQANRNLDAAIASYQSLATKFDQDRQLAATAVFRLGECYRTLGKTNEAAAQYQRILKDFSDQQTLATLSRQNLTGMGMSLDSATNSDVLQRLFAQRQKEMTIGNSDEESQEIQRIQTMIQNSPDLINRPSSDDVTPLFEAARKDELRVAAFLIDHGADIDAGGGTHGKIWWDWSPLIGAANAGHKAMVELLLKRGADVNRKSGNVGTALCVAAKNGFQSVAEVLLANKADVNVSDNSSETPLHLAVQNNNPKIVSMLLEHKAGVNAQNKNGATPLIDAAIFNHPEIIKLLLAAGANPNLENNDGRTPLSYAAENGSTEMVKMLLAAKADPNGGTLDAPLLVAIHAKDTNSAELLLQAGANPNAVGKIEQFDHHDNYFLNNKDHLTPLWLAIYLKQFPMVQLLLKFKADPNDSQTDGRPLLFGALEKPDILKALLDAGAKADARDETDSVGNTLYKRTALMMAAAGASYTNQIEALLQHGADANARDNEGRTALHWAACNAPADESVFALLLNSKADPNVRDNYGKTPLDYLKDWRQSNLKGRFVKGRFETVAAKNELVERLVALLHQHGALDKLPDWNSITVSRPAANFSFAILHKGTNDWNQFTLLEAILNFYESSQSYSVPQGNNTFAGYPLNSMLPFPDLTRVVILRPRHDSTNETRIVANLLNSTNGIDCAKDVPLEFGDVVEISEREHSLGENVVGLTAAQFLALADYVKGSAKLIAHGQTVELPFYRLGNQAALGVVLKQPAAQKALLSSSDLSQVKVIRHDPKTGKTLEWIVDCSDHQSSSSQAIPQSPSTFQTRLAAIISNSQMNNSQPSTDLWLRDGDVIEVPEKP